MKKPPIVFLGVVVVALCTVIFSVAEAQSPSSTGYMMMTGTTPVQSETSSALPILSPLFSNLKMGMRGEHVRMLQSFLALDKQIYPEGYITGYYGPLTSKAVQRMQLKYGALRMQTESELGRLIDRTPIVIEKTNMTTSECLQLDTFATSTQNLLNFNAHTATLPFCIILTPGIVLKLPGYSTTTP